MTVLSTPEHAASISNKIQILSRYSQTFATWMNHLSLDHQVCCVNDQHLLHTVIHCKLSCLLNDANTNTRPYVKTIDLIDHDQPFKTVSFVFHVKENALFCHETIVWQWHREVFKNELLYTVTLVRMSKVTQVHTLTHIYESRGHVFTKFLLYYRILAVSLKVKITKDKTKLRYAIENWLD